MLIAPKNLPSFLEDLKVLVELGYDAQFKLTQSQTEDSVKKFIDIIGGSTITKDIVRSFVEIDTIFDQSLFPEDFESKEVYFVLDSATCSNVLAKFHSRFHILSDELAKISFKSSKKEEEHSQENNDEFNPSESEYTMELSSKHMKTVVLNKVFVANFNDASNMKEKYNITLKKDVFMKFFSVLKLPGQSAMKINHNNLIEMDYVLEKCPFISVTLETSARNI